MAAISDSSLTPSYKKNLFTNNTIFFTKKTMLSLLSVKILWSYAAPFW